MQPRLRRLLSRTLNSVSGLRAAAGVAVLLMAGQVAHGTGSVQATQALPRPVDAAAAPVASTPSTPSVPTAGAPQAAVGASAPRMDLDCTVTTNCVNTLDSGGMPPLAFRGSPEQAMAVLRATLVDFPEAKIIKADALSVQAVFTTTLGFRDLVDFRIDAAASRIDYRSRSTLGLYDFGKNRSRMAAFASRFAHNSR